MSVSVKNTAGSSKNRLYGTLKRGHGGTMLQKIPSRSEIHCGNSCHVCSKTTGTAGRVLVAYRLEANAALSG